MATATRAPIVPVEETVTLEMSLAEAKYLAGVLLTVNPSAEAGLNDDMGFRTDTVYDALMAAGIADESGESLLALVVASGNTPEGTP